MTRRRKRCVSLGKANDNPIIRIAIELRAAEIVADGSLLWPEALGFDNEDDSEPTGPREHSPAWHAGYLARQIVEHHIYTHKDSP
jgi:hypothetical protein